MKCSNLLKLNFSLIIYFHQYIKHRLYKLMDLPLNELDNKTKSYIYIYIYYLFIQAWICIYVEVCTCTVNIQGVFKNYQDPSCIYQNRHEQWMKC